MPELPDVTVYIEALTARILHQPVERLRLGNPFVVRTIEPSPGDLAGRTVIGLRRLGKRIVLALDEDLFVVVHLMIAGRFRWRPPGAPIPGKVGLAAFDFPTGTLILTEAGSRRQASIHVFRGQEALDAVDPGGLDVLACDLPTFAEALTAYSDEILHAAKLSPMKLTRGLAPDEIVRLFEATRTTLALWIDRLRTEAAGEFPEKVTAFRAGMAAHGRYGQPCPACGAPIQRIVYARNEANYCARCQTAGRLLSDRALSRLLKEDWPGSLDEMEARKAAHRGEAPG
jgi:formamidopyrimidine-DNA glycosylase